MQYRWRVSEREVGRWDEVASSVPSFSSLVPNQTSSPTTALLPMQNTAATGNTIHDYQCDSQFALHLGSSAAQSQCKMGPMVSTPTSRARQCRQCQLRRKYHYKQHMSYMYLMVLQVLLSGIHIPTGRAIVPDVRSRCYTRSTYLQKTSRKR